jgi:signal recognition particle subunit SRP54
VLDNLKQSFEKTITKLSGRGKLNETDVVEASREIKLALLGADVHYGVVKDFVDAVARKAVGEEVLRSITPAQQFTKIVHDELVRILGGEPSHFDYSTTPPLVVMVVGLQGSGKTTTAARLALKFKRDGRRPYLVPADVHRPAAIDQLRILAEKAGVDCWETEKGKGAVKVVKSALKHADKIGYDTIVIDTAGRLHIDEEMMDEVRDIEKRAKPHRILYVADSMTGQDAVKSAKAFDESLPITGIVLTKIDGDARGGAALSVRHVTGKPILFVGTGEKLEDLEQFHPDRMAGRILGKGDVVSLVEKVAESVDASEAEGIGEALRKGQFTMEDFLKQMKMIKKLGPLDKILGLMPRMGGIMKKLDSVDVEGELKRKEAIVSSMTRQERKKPKILNGSRRSRIATGAGVKVTDVNRFMKEFDTMERMMRRVGRGGLPKGLLKGLTGQPFS